MQEASLEQKVTFLGDLEINKLSDDDLKKFVLKL